jgi:hypothetical protein
MVGDNKKKKKRKQSTSFAILITRFTGQRAAPAIS